MKTGFIPTVTSASSTNRRVCSGSLLTILLSAAGLFPSSAFLPLSAAGARRTQPSSVVRLSGKDDSPQDVDALSKTSWYVVEAFGNLFGSGSTKGKSDDDVYSLANPPASVEETLKRIQDDFSRSYFLSGDVDSLIYDEMCIFSDPFVSFEGRDRFISNLANLGSFVTKFSVRPLEFNSEDPSSVKTKVMVKLELGLPWRPVLAWPWGVEYKIDSESYLITDHKETWDIEPIEGVKQIFRKPTTQV